MGAAVIAPFGARSYLGAGGSSYISFNTRGIGPNGEVTLGTLDVKVADWTFGLLPVGLIVAGQDLIKRRDQVTPDCPAVPVHPPGVNIKANIKEAEKHGFANDFNPFKPLLDLQAGLWFRNQVKNNAPWDYKQQGQQYIDFGNFNYGATGLAVGFDERTLLREAGRAQQAAGTSRPGWGDPGNRLNPWGGTPPFGDDPADQAWIKKGFDYYKAVKRGCK